jgi:nitroreductase
MELADAMRHSGSTRRFRPDPVPDEVIERALELARFAPNGGNRQPTRWIVVRDAEQRRRLAELYVPHWKADLAQYLDGRLTTGSTLDQAVADADHLAEHLHEVPVIFVACARVEDMHPAALDDGEPNFIAGASVYTVVQNLCLALRDAGIGTSITTLICKEREREAEVLGLPDGVLTACHVAAGYPERPFPRRLRRLPVAETTFADRYGEPFAAAVT